MNHFVPVNFIFNAKQCQIKLSFSCVLFPTELPEQPKHCELRNDTIFEVVCAIGNDGGLPQYFMLEVIGGNPVSPDLGRNDFDNNMNNNEISTMNDQATTAPLRRIKESVPEFKLFDLEPGREYQFLVYAVNAKGRSHPPVVMQGKTFNDIIGPHGKYRFKNIKLKQRNHLR